MTIATVKVIAKDFLTRTEPGVLAFKGAWGVGKTHFWDNLVTELGSSLKPTRYSYVSLFGIASKRELSIALYANVQDFKAPPSKGPRRIRRIHVWLPIDIIAATAWCAKYIAKYRKYNPFGDIPWIKNLPRSFEAFVSHRIMNSVICLDDFERLDENSLPPEELMGFINELKEKKGCKVVLIFNGDKLENKKCIYEKYREKVIDMELLYAPTTQEAAAIAVPPESPCRDTLEECATKLEITNIRVLRKIVWLFKLMHVEVAGLQKGVIEQSMRTLILFAWSYYEREEKKPTVDFIITRDRYRTFLDNKSDKDPQVVQWDALLKNYGFAYADDLDFTIKRIIECGYLEETGFSESARALDAKIQRGLNQKDLETIWEGLNNSFDDNLSEFVEALHVKFKEYVKFIYPKFLNSMVIVLRELGHGSLADEMITDYIKERDGETDLFDMENSTIPGLLYDPILLDRFKAQHAKAHAILSLDETITYVMTHNIFDNAHVKPLQEATAEEFYDCFKRYHGNDFVNFVRAATTYAGIRGNEATAQKIHSTLVRIGKESLINRFRVQRFGITKEQLDESS